MPRGFAGIYATRIANRHVPPLSEEHKKLSLTAAAGHFAAYDENVASVMERLKEPMAIERLQDAMRRVKAKQSYEALANTIPKVVEEFAPVFPRGGTVSSQNVYDFLKIRSPSIPSMPRRLAFHAFLMVVDEAYREQWAYHHFVQRTGLALVDYLAITRKSDPYAHAANLQKYEGLFAYGLNGLSAVSTRKPRFEQRLLLLASARDMPFMLAYDFDFLDLSPPKEAERNELAADMLERFAKSWDLDARVGFYVPKRSASEGILLLNSFKWDWPTCYATLSEAPFGTDVADRELDVDDIIITDVNSFLNIDRSERTYFGSDHEVPDNRVLRATRYVLPDQVSTNLAQILERKFDWGVE